MTTIDPVELLKRQYLQLLSPEQLTLPSKDLLRLPGIQAQIFNSMFDASTLKFSPSNRYKLRVLKQLVKALEDAVEDPEEDEISDDMSEYLAQLMAQPLPSASTAAQQKSYVTYTLPEISYNSIRITLLEAPSLLASSGTTGFRTWEAALFLGAYLASSDGRHLIHDKKVIEVGAGTGFLSILCAKHLSARYVLATDGSREVITDIKTNIDLNSLHEGDLIQTGIIEWGPTFISGLADRVRSEGFDLVIGSDVTYDVKSIPPLVATMRGLFELYPRIRCLISATVRNEGTLDTFIQACSANGFTIERVHVPLIERGAQIGFFVPTTTPIRTFLITKEGPSDDLLGS